LLSLLFLGCSRRLQATLKYGSLAKQFDFNKNGH
jgi:hypothetical protein